MAASLDRPKIIVPTGCPGGGAVVGTGSNVLVHTLVSGTDEVDAVTVLAWGSTSSAAIVVWPTTTGGTTSPTINTVAGNGVDLVIDRWEGNGGADVFVNGPATIAFKVSVTRYPVGTNEPQEARRTA